MRLLTWVLWAATIPALSATPLFTLDPLDGALVGRPGQMVGWGLTIQNDDSGWLVITSATYDQTTSIGDFFEFVTPQFFSYALPPNETWTRAFNPVASEGIGAYVIDGSFALPGDSASGNLDLLFDIHSVDPNAPDYDPGNDTVSGFQELLPASVTYQTGPEVPEPASVAMTLAGLALCGFGLKVARRRS